ncbi:anthranilate synthase component 1 [Chitinivorax tropicus]|uniref:Anthranilate synthase component 1 n=1 Tax=Chitinivorax tropicus TaxID=714531 RepID=A0A840MKH7_9PROT|nr:aminodeoxychorismate synthase component I [Chitinivorax tropicus]MBB5017649.1 anthranilate synthase component 1 [Chitinivorax tropicus]
MHYFKLDRLPDLMGLHAAAPARFPYLLQSSGPQGWDLLFACPRDVTLFWPGDPRDVFSVLDRRAGSSLVSPQEHDPARPPFKGGWFVYLGYEMLHAIEPSVPVLGAPTPFPNAMLADVPAAICINRTTSEAWVVVEQGAETLLDELVALCRQDAPWQPQAISLTDMAEEDPGQFVAGVDKIKRYIREGDVFQVNLSREWSAALDATIRPIDLFHALRVANPAPFSGLVRLSETHSIVSSSPERLLRVQNGWADTRPIAGTHPRSADPIEDAALKARLIGSIKERAEHVMLIDLERNDLGRVCVPGTVQVDELMAVCSYAYVHHIESNVKGRLRADVTPAAAIRALFPGGTITGCPKVRTMQIIAELESGPRCAYTGSFGYVNRDGSMDLNILIRTFMQTGHQLRFRAGAGIVADSDRERELQETRAKARGLLRALGVSA